MKIGIFSLFQFENFPKFVVSRGIMKIIYKILYYDTEKNYRVKFKKI